MNAKLTLLSLLACATPYVSLAQSGAKGPTDWQLQDSIFFSHRLSAAEVATDTTTANITLKHWTGKETGYWQYLSVPASRIDSSKGTTASMRNVSAAVGFRAMKEFKDNSSIHSMAACVGMLPVGSASSNSLTFKGTIIASYFNGGANGKRYEAMVMAEHSAAGDYLSTVLSRQIAEKWRAGIGGVKNTNGVRDKRATLAYIPSKDWNAELSFDKSPSGYAGALVLRHNL